MFLIFYHQYLHLYWTQAEIIAEQLEVISDLGLKDNTTFRDLTKYLLDHIEKHINHIQPPIIGKMFIEQASNIYFN